jgi:aspartyl-tRNA(Asn)/glutamyl-tRNA(Gln) amidotransferase subunit C
MGNSNTSATSILRGRPSGAINRAKTPPARAGMGLYAIPKDRRMQIDEATVRHVARLARIKVSAEETASLKRELTSILEWVEQLGEVDTSAVEPMTRMGEMKLPLRRDEVTAGDMAEAVVKNAPLTEDHYFLVPKVVE